MIFFGTKATNLKNGQIINIDCPSCETNATYKYSVFGKYAHIYWIPIFPISKITVAECNSCKKTYEFKELSESIKTKFQREKEKSPVKFPIWMFSGCFIILLLIGYGFYDSYNTDINNANYIKNPKVGDVYYLKISEKHYTTSRVDKVTRTDVYLTNNDYEIDLESDISSIDKYENYTTSKDTVSVLQIQDVFKKETIIEVKRN